MKKEKAHQAEMMFRNAEIEQEVVNEEERTVSLSFSSETPVERSFGNEILDHEPSSVDLSRLNGKAPLLLEHDRSQQIGVVEAARIDDDKVGRAVVRFSKSKLGSEIWEDVKDGIRSLVSVGYSVKRFVKESSEETGDSVRAMDWAPLEISIVSIPADMSVGVGRCEEMLNTEEPEEMEEPKQAEEIRQEEPQKEVRIEVKQDKRAADIAALGARFDASSEAVSFINENRSVEEFKEHLMRRNETQPVEPQQSPEVGMGERDNRAYSLVKAIREAGEGKLSGLELEAHEAVASRSGVAPKGFFVPNDVLNRDLTATDANDDGDKLISTDLGEFVPALQAGPVVAQLGARVLSGLSGNVTLPKGGALTAAWLGENDAASETTMSIGQVSLSPKRVAAFSDLSKQLLAQASYDVEGIVRSDLLNQLALAIDAAAINGSGSSNEPTGIINTSGVNTASGIDRDGAIDCETAVMADNAMGGNPAYVMAPSVRGTLKKTATDSGSGRFVMEGSELNGYRAVATTQCPASTLLFGDFSQLIVGEFGSGVDVVVDPYTNALNGITRIYVSRFADIAVRHAEAFAVAT